MSGQLTKQQALLRLLLFRFPKAYSNCHLVQGSVLSLSIPLEVNLYLCTPRKAFGHMPGEVLGIDVYLN